MLKHKNTYEIISPEDIGLIRSNESGIVLGKLRYTGSTPVKAVLMVFDTFSFVCKFLKVSKVLMLDIVSTKNEQYYRNGVLELVRRPICLFSMYKNI